jgi:hypothetical protein
MVRLNAPLKPLRFKQGLNLSRIMAWGDVWTAKKCYYTRTYCITHYLALLRTVAVASSIREPPI